MSHWGEAKGFRMTTGRSGAGRVAMTPTRKPQSAPATVWPRPWAELGNEPPGGAVRTRGGEELRALVQVLTALRRGCI